MKYVYVIISEHYIPDLKYYQPNGDVKFAFTSLKKAKDQMLKIKELIENGGWYAHDIVPTKHTIESFREYFPELTHGYLWMDLKVVHSKDGFPDSYTFYSLRRHELNQGYGI